MQFDHKGQKKIYPSSIIPLRHIPSPVSEPTASKSPGLDIHFLARLGPTIGAQYRACNTWRTPCCIAPTGLCLPALELELGIWKDYKAMSTDHPGCLGYQFPGEVGAQSTSREVTRYLVHRGYMGRSFLCYKKEVNSRSKRGERLGFLVEACSYAYVNLFRSQGPS